MNTRRFMEWGRLTCSPSPDERINEFVDDADHKDPDKPACNVRSSTQRPVFARTRYPGGFWIRIFRNPMRQAQ